MLGSIRKFSSSIFALDKGETERISMAEIHSMDNIQGSPGGDQQDVPALFALKKTIQLIYETDYRFADEAAGFRKGAVQTRDPRAEFDEIELNSLGDFDFENAYAQVKTQMPPRKND